MDILDEMTQENKSNKGLLMQLQHFSVHDGEGIRTTLFMAGCPLRCQWCANPESWEETPLVDSSSGKALRQWWTLEAVVQEIRRQLIFYRHSGGGVTYSGGEPTCQPVFLQQMVDTFYAMGVDQAIETCGHFQWDLLAPALEKLDAFFVDMKTMDDTLHQQVTGKSNQLILENLKRIGAFNKPVVVRIPLIPGVNNQRENIRQTAAFVRQHMKKGSIEVLPYHSLGLEKYQSLGLPHRQEAYRVPTHQEVKRVKEIIREMGVAVTSY